MYKNLKNYRKKLIKNNQTEEAKNFNFFPLTFNLPNDYTMFISEYKKNYNQIWIMKPACKAQGKGIFLVNNINQIISWKNNVKHGDPNEVFVAQKYVMNPFLLGGKKFDMRIYALVTTYSPLTIYLNRTGFARFTHARYTNSDRNNTYIHLTNVAIQKNCKDYNSITGGKWNLRNMKIYLYSKYSREKVDNLYKRIQDTILKSILSVEKVIVNDKHSFELYGFDIMIDDELNPILLEINANPSLTANTPQDNKIKVDMLDDVFTILDLEKVLEVFKEDDDKNFQSKNKNKFDLKEDINSRYKGAFIKVGGFDLIYRGEEIKKEDYILDKTYLGCSPQRDFNLKSLAKKTFYKMNKIHSSK